MLPINLQSINQSTFSQILENMKLKYYRSIIEQYRQLQRRNCLQELSLVFPDVPLNTLECIIFQEYLRKIKKSYYIHTSAKNVKKYYDRFLKNYNDNWNEYGALLKLADEVDLSPALMAKLILESHYNESIKKNENIEKTPNQKPRVKVNDYLKNPSLIDDPYLAAEVRMCVLADENYGPVSDTIKNLVGLEYENKLKTELTKLDLAFIDERQLRDRGYDKTPDVKFDTPIAVDGQIINWIESKASFGDEERHKEYLREQYWSYCNRFGPGLVIYWAGYIDELNINKEQGIVISDKLPDEIVRMDPAMLLKKVVNKTV